LGARCIFDGPINGRAFRGWVDQQMLDTIRAGDIVVMDNLGSHNAADIRKGIKARGARLWDLPDKYRALHDCLPRLPISEVQEDVLPPREQNCFLEGSSARP